MAQPSVRKAGDAGAQQDAVDVALILRGGGGRKSQRGRPEVKIEQTVAQTRLVVVIALGLSSCHNLDLSAVQAEAFIDCANLRLGRLRVGQENAAGAAFDNRWRNA